MKILVTLSLLIAVPVTVMSQGGSTPLPPEATTEMSGPVPTMTPEPINDTPSPTSPGIPVAPAKFPNLSMSLTGVTTLSESSWSTFEETYMTFNTAFYEANPQFGVTDLDILLELVSQDPPLAPTRRLGERQLQETLTLVYNQALTYKIIPDSNLEQADVVTLPFATQTSRDVFAELLRESGDPAFTTIDSVSSVTQAALVDSTVTPVEGATPTPVDGATTAIGTPTATTQDDGLAEPVAPSKFPNLSISLTGVTTLSESSWSTFEETYMTFNTAFYEANPQFGVTDLDILLELVSQDPPLAPTRRLGKRQLQETLTLVYNQALTYKISPDSNLQPPDVVTLPFATQTSRGAFAALLRDSNDTAFTNIDSVSNVTQQGVAESTSMAPVGTTPSSVTESTAAASVTDGATEAATTLSPGNTASECTTETSALNADTLIQMEYSNIGAAIETDATNDFLGFCNLLELLCLIDANNYSSNLTSACTAAGGQVTTKSLSFACSGTLNAIPIPEGLEVSVSNWPICIGNSCDPNALPAEIEEQIDTTVNEMVNQIEAGLGGDVMCESLGGNETGTTVVPPSTTPAPVSDTTLAPITPPTTEPPTSLACSLRAFGTVMLGLAVALVIGAL